ncbi:FAD-dependent oxidoreductase [Leifsonia sp. 21MFCrub1.1]|uniref:FAD-dependent oxidoreductase n=1 Tax=Leifsonia sp. 21MFCrub1.1 TaxID=1798223 RepID=UPI0008929DEB|nr:FAD-dependent oxidoreductase [Leifsonia sp. 21MFCrub1.1]SEB09910.1 FAD dependent oxidoreductase [Leifsonia sp. 21MFCrub1.1]
MTDRIVGADLLVVGGGLGGVAAALTAARLGLRVVLTERSDWLGGQLTTQAVPPDEHHWIETGLGSASYRELRQTIREHYRRHYPLTPEAAADPQLNPGRGNVSRLCHEPRVAALAIDELLSPHVASGALTVLREHAPVDAEHSGRTITRVRLRGPDGDHVVASAPLIADATEEGDLIALCGLDHVIGAESRDETGELHAPDLADPRDQQAITWCAALEYRPGENHTIARPAEYEHWRDTVDPRWPGPQLSWRDIVPNTGAVRDRPLFADSPETAVGSPADDLWHYRRILARSTLDPAFPGGEVTLVNWPQADYWERPLLDVGPTERERALAGARSLTNSLIYWLQTEAPRHDGGQGYPELRPRGDVMGTPDGLAKEVYIRESRRIRALFTITEGHIGTEMRGALAGSALFPDTVGIGHYRIDLHPSTSGRGYVDIDCFPFQIPLGALIPVDSDTVVAANKNIGTTHVSNGAYRLHPVEWSIGEAIGALAAELADGGGTPAAIRSDPARLSRLQATLRDRLGVTLEWPEGIRTGRIGLAAPAGYARTTEAGTPTERTR